MSVALLLGLGIAVFFAFFAWMGRVRKAGAQPLPVASRRLEIRSGPEATSESVASLLARADLRSGRATPAQLAAILPALGAARGFPEGSWSPDDLPRATSTMHERFQSMGLELLKAEDIHRVLEELRSAEPSADRRRQIGQVLQRANRQLERASDPRRFRAYAEDLPGWDPDEPAWLLCDEAEHRMLTDMDLLRPRSE
jgi:hypothetical protein